MLQKTSPSTIGQTIHKYFTYCKLDSEEYFFSDYPEGPFIFCIIRVGTNMLRYCWSRKIFRSLFVRSKPTILAVRQTEINDKIRAAVKRHFLDIRVVVSSDPGVIDTLVSSYFTDVKFFGIDCEWVSKKGQASSPVSLLQIASQDMCLLAQLSKMSKLPPELSKVLSNKHVLKFGVGIQEDVKRLENQFGVNVRGWVDLRYLVLRCCPDYNSDNSSPRAKGMSLSALALNLPALELDKSFKVRCSNWEAESLSEVQVAYAATDAIAALMIFHCIVLRKQADRGRQFQEDYLKNAKEKENELKQPVLHSVTFYSIDLLGRKVNNFQKVGSCNRLVETEGFLQTGMSLCKGIIELNFSGKMINVDGDTSKKRGNKKSKEAEINTRQEKASKIPIRNHPLYENCYLQSPDGTVLCTCDSKKAYWYVERTGASLKSRHDIIQHCLTPEFDINVGEICFLQQREPLFRNFQAIVINKDPLTVRLNFEPAGRPLQDADYYTTVKENRCVVCGRDDKYVRKMIIPHDYRRYFPSEYKDHLSHDVLLLCPPCHMISRNHDDRLRRELSIEYNAPLGTYGNLKYTSSKELVKVRASAKALLVSGPSIPEARRKELENIVLTHANAKEISTELLEELVAMDVRVNNDEYVGSHGEIVVKQLREQNKVREFVKMWREHFLSTMEPQYLPAMWSTDHNLDRRTEILL